MLSARPDRCLLLSHPDEVHSVLVDRAADFVLYPYLGYCARVTFRKPETKLDELVPAPIAEYKKRLEALPYFDKTFPPHWR